VAIQLTHSFAANAAGCLGEARLHRDDRWYLAGHTAVTERGLHQPCNRSSGATVPHIKWSRAVPWVPWVPCLAPLDP
jgi:hypothetical protein